MMAGDSCCFGGKSFRLEYDFPAFIQVDAACCIKFPPPPSLQGPVCWW